MVWVHTSWEEDLNHDAGKLVDEAANYIWDNARIKGENKESWGEASLKKGLAMLRYAKVWPDLLSYVLTCKLAGLDGKLLQFHKNVIFSMQASFEFLFNVQVSCWVRELFFDIFTYSSYSICRGFRTNQVSIFRHHLGCAPHAQSWAVFKIFKWQHFCCFITQLVKKLQHWSLYEVIKDILPFVLNPKWPLSDIWLLRCKQNSFVCF